MGKVEKVMEVEKIDVFNTGRISSWLHGKIFPRSNPTHIKYISEVLKKGFYPNPELAEIYREKLKLPEKEIPEDWQYPTCPFERPVIESREVPEINNNLITVDLLKKMADNVYFAHQFNNHKAIRQLIYLFENGLKPNVKQAEKYVKDCNEILWARPLTPYKRNSKKS